MLIDAPKNVLRIWALAQFRGRTELLSPVSGEVLGGEEPPPDPQEGVLFAVALVFFQNWKFSFSGWPQGRVVDTELRPETGQGKQGHGWVTGITEENEVQELKPKPSLVS